MKIFITLASQELKRLWRDSTFQVLAVFLLLLSGYAIFSSTEQYGHAYTEHHALTDTARYMLQHQKPTSAHMAGHYGHIVFKPATFLQAIDPGVNAYTGTTVRLEAHRQNEAVFIPASGQSSLIRFGEFSFAMLLQVIFPLLILFTCYRSIIADRQNGTLRLLLCQGVSMRQLITARAAAYIAVYWTFLLLAALVYGLVFYMGQHEAGAGVLPRVFLLVFLYGLYYALLIALTVYLSARANSPSGLLVGLLAAWFIFTVIIPKTAANIGAQRTPLPTRVAFDQSIADDRKGGINGHDTRNERSQRFTDSVLRAHGVDSASQLPVKLGGLLMQADEDFNNYVYDKAITRISSIISAQNRVGAVSGFADPFMAVKNLSMAIAGTDMHHHYDFTKDVEDYRRVLIRDLNKLDAARVSEFKDSKGKLTQEYWDQVKDYRYESPALGWSLANYITEIIALFTWIVAVCLLIALTSNKIRIA
ncbi:DUF3526 domain-containing protein [Chitinophaga cymbidii]|uniref:ABC transporter permease n=1 Tax=Chitinophaga cymbidii TaxID=1096750 RepID=A0A512RPN7_9BACT|nr:DUF3526 domain-containing protein [Chitinophaga cymbidii]GEP97651.1 hypothetical protein CCY01nite_39110 [Chitinophaga cymbidii]